LVYEEVIVRPAYVRPCARPRGPEMTTDPWSFPVSQANSPRKSEMTTDPWSFPARPALALGVLGAVRATALHGQVPDVRREPAVALQRLDERRHDVRVDLAHLAAPGAHEMRVIRAARRVVRGSAVPEVRVCDQLERLEQLERAVDRR